MSRSGRRRLAGHAQGFSLLELMLAATLGVAMTTATAQLFISSSRGQAALTAQARLQESARHALDFLAHSARNAGYLGCGTAGQLANGLNGTWGQVVEIELSTPIEAFEVTAGAGLPSRAELPVRGGAPAYKARNRINLSRLQPGSDIVVFRRADIGTPLARPLRDDADPIVLVDAARTLRKDSFALLSTCGQAELFHVSSVAKRGGLTTLVRAPGGGLFDNRSGTALRPGNIPYGSDTAPRGAAAALAITEMYFVARHPASPVGETLPSLWRKTSTAAPAELVPGIVDLQLLFGIDTTPTDDARAPNRYVPGAAVGARPVRTVQVAVTVSSATVPALPNGVHTRTFSRTVAVRN